MKKFNRSQYDLNRPNLCGIFESRIQPFAPGHTAATVSIGPPKEFPPILLIQVTLLLRIHGLVQGYDAPSREEIATRLSKKRLEHDMHCSHKICKVRSDVIPGQVPNLPWVVTAFVVVANVPIASTNHQAIVGDDKLSSGCQENSQHESEQCWEERHRLGDFPHLHVQH